MYRRYSHTFIFQIRTLRQKIDLWDTGKSRYFAITEFNNCFIIRSPSLFFKEYLREAKRSAIFTQERSQEGEKRGLFTHEQNSICSQKQLNDIAHEHTIICRQLFAGHVVGSRPMKRNRMIYHFRSAVTQTLTLYQSAIPIPEHVLGEVFRFVPNFVCTACNWVH